MSNVDVLKEIERTSSCEKCKHSPSMWLWYDGIIISGCDEHMVEIAEVSSASEFYNKRYLHYGITEDLEGNC